MRSQFPEAGVQSILKQAWTVTGLAVPDLCYGETERSGLNVYSVCDGGTLRPCPVGTGTPAIQPDWLLSCKCSPGSCVSQPHTAHGSNAPFGTVTACLLSFLPKFLLHPQFPQGLVSYSLQDSPPQSFPTPHLAGIQTGPCLNLTEQNLTSAIQSLDSMQMKTRLG